MILSPSCRTEDNLCHELKTEYKEVVECGIKKFSEWDVRLAIKVEDSTTIYRKKEIGEAFIRKAFAYYEGKKPGGRIIGTGDFDYMVMIAYPEEEYASLLGIKLYKDDSIFWSE